jgi:outer membrane immunogenic protein
MESSMGIRLYMRRFVLLALQFSLVTSAISFCLSQAASAQHISAAPVARTSSAYDWSGFYVGGQVGASWTQIDWDKFNATNTDRLSQSGNRPFGGTQIGLQFQRGNIVAGLEVSYVDGFSNGWISSTSVLNVDRSRQSRLGSIWMLTPRLGYTWNRWLSYIKGGYANGKVDFESFITSTQQITASSYGRKSGWTLGAGFEYALINNLSIGLEYDYLKLNVGGHNDNPAPGFAQGAISNVNAHVHLLMARLNYKFRAP